MDEKLRNWGKGKNGTPPPLHLANPYPREGWAGTHRPRGTNFFWGKKALGTMPRITPAVQPSFNFLYAAAEAPTPDLPAVTHSQAGKRGTIALVTAPSNCHGKSRAALPALGEEKQEAKNSIVRTLMQI